MFLTPPTDTPQKTSTTIFDPRTSYRHSPLYAYFLSKKREVQDSIEPSSNSLKYLPATPEDHAGVMSALLYTLNWSTSTNLTRVQATTLHHYGRYTRPYQYGFQRSAYMRAFDISDIFGFSLKLHKRHVKGIHSAIYSMDVEDRETLMRIRLEHFAMFPNGTDRVKSLTYLHNDGTNVLNGKAEPVVLVQGSAFSVPLIADFRAYATGSPDYRVRAAFYAAYGDYPTETQELELQNQAANCWDAIATQVEGTVYTPVYFFQDNRPGLRRYEIGGGFQSLPNVLKTVFFPVDRYSNLDMKSCHVGIVERALAENGAQLNVPGRPDGISPGCYKIAILATLNGCGWNKFLELCGLDDVPSRLHSRARCIFQHMQGRIRLLKSQIVRDENRNPKHRVHIWRWLQKKEQALLAQLTEQLDALGFGYLNMHDGLIIDRAEDEVRPFIDFSCLTAEWVFKPFC